jgi:hypothetical protein
MLCPQCGIGLFEEPSAVTVLAPDPQSEESPEGPPFLRRMGLGAITLLGLYNGLKHLALAGLLTYTSASSIPMVGLVCLLVASTLVAAVAAGTVNRRAEVAGLLLAVGASFGFLAPTLSQGAEVPEKWLVSVPTLLLLVGVAGGTAGRLMIPPPPTLPRFSPVETPIKVVRRKRRVRLTWWRIIAGSVLITLGTNYAEVLRHWLLFAVGGGGGLGSATQVSWQISMLMALAGGVLAGGRTRAGFRQGFFAGMLASIGTVIAVATLDSSPPLVLQFWLDQFEVKASGPGPYAALAMTTWLATTLGGWLGEQLVPAGDRT